MHPFACPSECGMDEEVLINVAAGRWQPPLVAINKTTNRRQPNSSIIIPRIPFQKNESRVNS